MSLNGDHDYYHQVQLQLYVSSDLYDWCDFCVFSNYGVMVERITLDMEWVQKYIDQLEHYYDEYVLPEIVYPVLKRRLLPYLVSTMTHFAVLGPATL